MHICQALNAVYPPHTPSIALGCSSTGSLNTTIRAGSGDAMREVPDDTDADPVASLDRELALLIGEVAEVTTLLGETEHPELARRLG